MIQRIQTLFLLFAAAFQLSMLFFPIVVYSLKSNEMLILSASGFKTDVILNDKLFSTTINSIFICVIAFLIFANIFLFKNRSLQMKICIFNSVLLIVFQLFIFWFAWDAGQNLEATTNYRLTIVFPVVSAILTILAYRSINNDEKLIRSIDRIR